MKKLFLLIAVAGLLSACVAPTAAPAQPVSQPVNQPSQPEVTVYRSPT